MEELRAATIAALTKAVEANDPPLIQALTACLVAISQGLPGIR